MNNSGHTLSSNLTTNNKKDLPSNTIVRFFIENKASIIITFVCFLLSFFGYLSHIFQPLNDLIYDFFIQKREKIVSLDERIKIVGMDDASLRDPELGIWPRWSRDNYAKVIDILNKDGARVIEINLVFPEFDETNSGHKNLLRATQSKKNLVFPVYYLYDKKQIEYLSNPIYQKAAFGSGNASTIPAMDGVTRALDPVVSIKNEFSPSTSNYQLNSSEYLNIGLEIIRAYYQIPKDQVTIADNKIKIGPVSIPLVYNKLLVNYNQRISEKQTIPFNKVYRNEFEPGTFKDKIVIIGSTSLGLHDYFTSPIEKLEPQPSVYLWAQVASNILQSKNTWALSNLTNVCLMLFLGMISWLLFYWVKNLFINIFSFLFLLPCLMGTAFILFQNSNLYLPLFTLTIECFLIFIGCSLVYRTGTTSLELKKTNLTLLENYKKIEKMNHSLMERNDTLLQVYTSLQESKFKLGLLLNNMKEGTILVDSTYRILLINPIGREFLNQIALSDKHTQGIWPNCTFDPLLNEVMEKKIIRVTEVRTQKGEARIFQITLIPVTSYIQDEETDQVLEALISDVKREQSLPGALATVIIRDVTNERKLQDQLLQSDKLSTIGQLVSGVAHELNNPLTSIIGFSELLLKTCTSEQEEYASVVVKEAKRSRTLVSNLLAFSRKHSIEKKRINLNNILESTLQLIEYDFKTSNIFCRQKIDKELADFDGDFYRLQQVLLNLLTNAQTAVIENDKIEKEITLKTWQEGKNIYLAVQDNGTGISEDNLKRVFDPFFTTKEVGKGTGLGLSLSYGIVKEHGGDIQVVSNPGEGTTFTLCFESLYPDSNPIENSYHITKSKSGELPPLELALQVRENNSKRVLIVDDEPSIISLLEAVFNQTGFQVDSANNGKQALVKLEEASFKYDLIFCDIRMPELDGKTLYYLLKENHSEILSNLIFMTGNTVDLDTSEFMEQTHCRYLTKPFKIQEVMKIAQDDEIKK